jgi:hypothetical protein
LWHGEQSEANSWAGVLPLSSLSWLAAGPVKTTVTRLIIGHRNDPLIIEPPCRPPVRKNLDSSFLRDCDPRWLMSLIAGLLLQWNFD